MGVIPVAAWLSCAHLSLDDLVVIGDALVRRKRPLATLEQLAPAGARYPARHARRILQALALIRARTDSPGETRLRLLIIRAELPEPAVNSAVRGERGDFIGFADLSYAAVRLIVEYEGEHHFADPRQVRHDIDRIAAFERAGWRVIRAHRSHTRLAISHQWVRRDLRRAPGLPRTPRWRRASRAHRRSGTS